MRAGAPRQAATAEAMLTAGQLGTESKTFIADVHCVTRVCQTFDVF